MELLQDRLNEALGVVGVVDREVLGVAQALPVDAEHAHAHGVERADPHAARAQTAHEPVEALAHLAGGLVGEGDGEDVPGHDAEVLDHVGDAVREHAGLARPRAGEDEQGPLGGEHGLTLGWVQGIDV